MRVLAIESSSPQGSVALLESGRLVVSLTHDEPNAHAERLLPLVEQALAEAGWSRATIERMGVGIGPGSFTGVRVGIALAQGLALGLGRPLVGVTSLAAMARAVPREVAGMRVPLLDARREEVFRAAYLPDGSVHTPPHTVAREVAARGGESAGPLVWVGSVAEELGLTSVHRASDSDLPHASWVGRIAAEAATWDLAVEPLYVREADAVKPREAPDALAGELREPGELHRS